LRPPDNRRDRAARPHGRYRHFKNKKFSELSGDSVYVGFGM
jgi:hypothetical protein